MGVCPLTGEQPAGWLRLCEGVWNDDDQIVQGGQKSAKHGASIRRLARGNPGRRPLGDTARRRLRRRVRRELESHRARGPERDQQHDDARSVRAVRGSDEGGRHGHGRFEAAFPDAEEGVLGGAIRTDDLARTGDVQRRQRRRLEHACSGPTGRCVSARRAGPSSAAARSRTSVPTAAGASRRCGFTGPACST